MNKNIIQITNTVSGNITLSTESAWFKIDNCGEIIEMPFEEYTLQDAVSKYRKILNLNAENIENHGHFQTGLGYISQKIMIDDAKRISKILKSIGLKNRYSHKGFHFTLQYDKRNPIIEANEMPRDQHLSARVIGVELLAPDSPVPALALIFESEDLQKRFNELREMGFIYDFENYLPHITVKYNPNESDLKLLQDNIQTIINGVGEVKTSIELWKKARTE